MSIIDPNKRQILLIDDFIRYAKEHLNTVQGTAFCSTNYIASLGVPTAGICDWKGYFVPDKVKVEPESLNDPYWAVAKNVESKFSSDLTDQVNPFIGLYTQEQQLTEGQYKELNKPNGTVSINYGNTPQTSFIGSNQEARKAAEEYLGKPIDDANWNALVAITYAEASTNQTERAWVMGTILNRVRIHYTPRGRGNPNYKSETVIDIISQPAQFQPVTGTRDNGHQPSKWYVEGPDVANAKSIYGAATNLLKDVPKDWYDFTSNDPRDYGKGTDIDYMYNLRKREKLNPPTAKVVGTTIFAK
jgi:hypothetical protein